MGDTNEQGRGERFCGGGGVVGGDISSSIVVNGAVSSVTGGGSMVAWAIEMIGFVLGSAFFMDRFCSACV